MGIVDDKGILDLKNKVEKLIQENEEYQNYTLDYILIDKKDSSKTIAIASYYDEIIEIKPNSKEINSIMEWAYNFDVDVFGVLENHKDIGYMSIECHYGIWNALEDYIIEETEHPKGIQKYLKYCKDNGITKEKIEQEIDLKEPIVPDVMKYYKPEKNKERGR